MIGPAARRLCLLLSVLAAILGACGDAEQETKAKATAKNRSLTATQPGGGCATTRTAMLENGFIRIPASARDGGTPLIVVVVPGGRGDPDDVLGVTRAATRRGFAVLSRRVQTACSGR